MPPREDVKRLEKRCERIPRIELLAADGEARRKRFVIANDGALWLSVWLTSDCRGSLSVEVTAVYI